MAQRPGVGAIPLDGVRVEPTDQGPEERGAEQLRLGHEVERPRRPGTDDGGVEQAHVVGREQDRPFARHVLPPDGAEPEEEPQRGEDQRLQELVEHTRSTSLAISSITSSMLMPLESM
jgi:hypothetical protein